MATEKQFAANRENAQKSTGPTTPEGKAAVRLNGLKYGLYAETLILPGEDAAQFEALLDGLDAEYQPATPTEQTFVKQIAMASWRRDRIQRTEVAFYRNEDERLVDLYPLYRSLDDDGRRALIANSHKGHRSALAGFDRYEARMDRSIKEAVEQLRKCRQARLALDLKPAPVERPKAKPSPKIINIETAEHPPAPVTEAPEAPQATETEDSAA